MIDYVEGKVATIAAHSVNFVAIGIPSTDAMHSITSPVANLAFKDFTSPVSSATVTDFLLLRQGITRFYVMPSQKLWVHKSRMLTIEVVITCRHLKKVTE